jgi:hypothetical protein
VVNIPSVPEIITVNSESLQTTVRDLLPSQNGFGSELQASNVITPIIDLTATAEGSSLAVDLARAIAFGSQTAFEIINTTTTLENSAGFYRVVGVLNVNDVGSNVGGGFTMTDGVTTKQVWASIGAGSSDREKTQFDLTFWLDSGITLTGFSDGAGTVLAGSIRQVADSEGLTVNPSGFPL